MADIAKPRTILATAAILFVAGSASDCANKYDEVKYTVAGKGTANIVYFDTDGKPWDRESVKLPWTWKSALPQKRVQLGVAANARGKVVCRILINNNQVLRNARLGECKVAFLYRPTQRAKARSNG